MKLYNLDGSEEFMGGNAMRCLAKYVYDNGIINKTDLTIETLSGVRKVKLYIQNGKAVSATVEMGKIVLDPKLIPVDLEGDSVINRPVVINRTPYNITCLNLGNPHCVVFCDNLDAIDVDKLGYEFEYNPLFPERVTTDFVQIINKTTIRMKVWERGSGATWSCGTGACVSAIAAILNGYCDSNKEITVKQKGGDLLISRDEDGTIYLSGKVEKIFDGTIEI